MRTGLWFTHSGCEHNVRYWPKADIASCTAHVRFWGYSGHDVLRRICLLLTQQRHCPAFYVAARSEFSALSKHLLEPVRCSLLGSWRVAR